MTGLGRSLAGAAAALALLAGCAPRPTGAPPVSGGTRVERYLAQLLLREQRAAMVEGAVTVWLRALAPCDTCPARRLPALQAGLALAWPDALRLRVSSVFGTALDLGLDGDSVTAYVPAQRWSVALDAVRDSLGLDRPGLLATRLVSAGWRPPEPAWRAGTWDGGLLVLQWSEAADSVALAVDEAGRPAWARLWRDGRRGVRVQYARWNSVDGTAWPVLLRLQEPGGAFALTCRVDRVSFAAHPDRSRLAVRIPDDTERIGLDRLRGLLERLGSQR
jgi:hypothetical protein